MNRIGVLSLAFILLALGSANAAQSSDPTSKSTVAAAGPAPGAAAQNSSQVSIESVLANNDLNKDGVITKAEATTADRNLIRTWDSYDLNGDNRVDRTELSKQLRATGSQSATTSPPTQTSPPSSPRIVKPASSGATPAPTPSEGGKVK